MANRFASLILALSLVGCSVNGQYTKKSETRANLSSSDWIERCEDYGYCLMMDELLDSAIGEENVTVYYTPNNAPGVHYEIQPYHSLEPKRISFPCDESSLINSITLKNNDDTKTIWGMAPPLSCPVDACDFSKFPESRYKGRYVLCSQHEGKGLRIELNEFTDDPALAKRTFESFYWKDAPK